MNRLILHVKFALAGNPVDGCSEKAGNSAALHITHRYYGNFVEQRQQANS
jgi:hypothetical protein